MLILSYVICQKGKTQNIRVFGRTSQFSTMAEQADKDCTSASMTHPSIAPLQERIEQLEKRFDRVEMALNYLLPKFRMPTLESFQLPPKTSEAKAPAPVSKQEQSVQQEKNPADLLPYKYEALDALKSEIRILALQPSSVDTGPIRCSLVRVSLDDDREKAFRTKSPAAAALRSYTGLSYTWGEAEFRSSIVVDDHVLFVTKNLEAALRQFRKPAPSTMNLPIRHQPVSYWWIDAVCINQADIDERNSQVALMRRIYKRAAGVRIWLGEEADDSAMAMDLVGQFADPPERGPGAAPVIYPSLSEDQTLRHWKALAALFRRPWWERAWIRQEVTLATFPKVQCGSASCGLHQFVKAGTALEYVTQYLDYDPCRSDHSNTHGAKTGWKPQWHESPATLDQLVKEADSGKTYTPLANLLFHSRTSKATDLRDKVFSLLGLADPEVYEVAADYRMPLSDVYTNTMRAILSSPDKLEIFSACQNPEGRHGLPSWVPNLADEWKAQPFPSSVRTRARKPDTILNKDGRILRVKGFRHGFVGSLSDTVIQDGDSTEQLQRVYTAWKQFAANGVQPGSKYTHSVFFGKQNDEYWLELLSIGTIYSKDLKYQETAEGLKLRPDQEPHFYTGGLDLRLVKALLLPRTFAGNSSPYARIHLALRNFGPGRRFGFAKDGDIGLFPQDAREGDLIVVLYGASFPYVIREQGEHYVLVGEACKLVRLVCLGLRSTTDTALQA